MAFALISIQTLCTLLGFIQITGATIDINLQEFQYLSDHLTEVECRRLIAAAHLGFDATRNAIDEAELRMPKDIPCLKLLLHWNSARGEGLGQTHEILEHHLRIMNKRELADWLGTTVFHELGQDLQNSLKHGFDEVVVESSSSVNAYAVSNVTPFEDPSEWLPMDTILMAILVASFTVLLVVLGLICMRKIKKQKPKKESEVYKLVVHDSSSSESEIVFDMNAHTIQ